MDYTPEQRAIVTRMGELSRRMDETVRRHQAAQIAAGRAMVDAVTRLTQAMERNEEVMSIFTQHGDAFREFLDTL